MGSYGQPSRINHPSLTDPQRTSFANPQWIIGNRQSAIKNRHCPYAAFRSTSAGRFWEAAGSSCLKQKEYAAPTNTRPPTMLPSVTGNRFQIRNCPQVTPAPSIIPTGTVYMFATLCSNPQATKAIIGNQI